MTNSVQPAQSQKVPRRLGENLAAFVGEIVALVAAEVALRIKDGSCAREHILVTQKTSPLPRRTFLEAARKRAFPSFQVGKLRFARLSEVVAFIEAHQVNVSVRSDTPAPEDDGDEIGRLLDETGIRARKRGAQ